MQTHASSSHAAYPFILSSRTRVKVVVNGLDTDTSLAPMSPLRIVSAHLSQISHLLTTSPPHHHTLTLLHFCIHAVITYRIVLPVLSLIHCGIGRFCFCALASFCLVRKVLWDYVSHYQQRPGGIGGNGGILDVQAS